MRKEGSGRGKEMAPKVAKPAVLSAEAAAMELKLAELRKAMEKERAKREALMANTSGGSIWRNGGTTSGLRSNVKGKGPGEGSPSSAAGGVSSSRRPNSVDAPAGQGAAAASSSAAGRASSARSAGATAGSEISALSGSRLTTSGRTANAAAAEPKGPGGRGAPASSSGGGGGAMGGMSCGTDDNSSLADGAFNEADSHKSFLDALNEWRRANRGDTPADAGAAGAASSAASSAQPQRPRSGAPPAPVASASLEVQTESRPASRPSSSTSLSYFDKLVINASSRVAGHLASGGPPESSRSSLSGQATGLPRPPSAARPLSASLSNIPSAAAKPPLAPAPAANSTRISASAAALAPSSCTTSAPGKVETDGTPPDPLSILDRLEALERQRQAAASHGDGDEEDGWGAASFIQVTTATGMVLTKGVRLPDEVLMPPNEGC
ncbi:hypothetical protein PLESTB_000916800 [Pleodorina starrii]|uniref:Uncharacterized protein n=1 Tax=Pleodorina starrii TaxID=330485 RepID=A0A9W6BNA9_9CHLO|nr:hypothetical protein PLESTB_000916800 [Pleodorina starrii]